MYAIYMLVGKKGLHWQSTIWYRYKYAQLELLEEPIGKVKHNMQEKTMRHEKAVRMSRE
jgi:hypothetical protein